MSSGCAVNNSCSDGQELLLARHGETADNAAHLIVGHRDPGLSDAGRAQAMVLARAARDAGIVGLWTSPLRRARQTAALVGELVGVEPMVLPDLIESDRGAWEGEPIDLIARGSPRLFAAFVSAQDGFAFPGGESLRQQVARTCAALDVVAAGPSPALAVAHAGTIRAALIALGQQPPPEGALPHGEMVSVRWHGSAASQPPLPRA
jgi:broad specificity phosphatase PhoE